MWLPSLIGERIKDMRSKGFRLTAEDIYSVNKASMKDAVVLFGRGCTGEIVSAEGLLLTNHHCGYGAIQSHSTLDHDYLTYGFWARSRDEELPNERLTVRILVRMEDVTDRIAAGADKLKLIQAARAEGPGYDASVEEMYYGNQSFLFVYQEFSDVRLVGAPPVVDRQVRRRYGQLDLAPPYGRLLRLPDLCRPRQQPRRLLPDNVPYRPRRHFAISTRGVKEGDFTMIYGFPGSTQQYILSDAVDYVQNLSDPMKIDLRTRRLDIISAAQEADPKVRIQYAAKHAGIANAWKKWQGEVAGLKRMNTLAAKRDYERRFAEWAADKPEYAGLLDSMRAAYARGREPYFHQELLSESIRSLELYPLVRHGVLSSSWRRGEDDAIAEQRRIKRAAFLKDYDPAVDRALVKSALRGFADYCPEGFSAEAQAEIDRHGGMDAYADYVFDHTRMLLPQEEIERLDSAAVVSDPIYRFVVALRRQASPRILSPQPEQYFRYRALVPALSAGFAGVRPPTAPSSPMPTSPCGWPTARWPATSMPTASITRRRPPSTALSPRTTPRFTTTTSRSGCATSTLRRSTAAGAWRSTAAARCPSASWPRTRPRAATPARPC